jgi:hypothetical protein
MAAFTSALANIFDVICFRAYLALACPVTLNIHSFAVVICLKYFLKVLTLVKTTIIIKKLLKINCPNIVIKYLFLKKEEFSLLKSNNKK